MTKKALEKLSARQRNALEIMRADYKRFKENGQHRYLDEQRSRISGFLDGLQMAEVLTLTERRLLFCYCTL